MRPDVDVLIIGAGHAGLCVASGLRSAGCSFLLVDAHERIGDSWRSRWDSLELFTPRWSNELPGLAFPRGASPFPGKDEVADYQETYARTMLLPVRLRSRVRGLSRTGALYEAVTDGGTLCASAVVIATGAFSTPRVPAFAQALGPGVTQLHSSEYRRPGLLPDGPVVVVGAANSGAEIAVEIARERPTVLAASRIFPLAPRRFRDPRWWRLAQWRTVLLRGRRPPAFLPWPIRVGGLTKVDLKASVREHGLRIAPRAVAAEHGTVRFSNGTGAPARTVIWATGVTVIWALIAILFIGWVNVGKSYRSVMLDLKSALPANYRCMASRGLGDAQRAMLHYYADIITQRVEENKKSIANCDVLLVQSGPREKATAQRGWKKIWEGQRPGDKDERYYLYHRPRR